MRDSRDSTETNYAGRMMVGAFDPVTIKRQWLKEHHDFFGHSGALVYHDFCDGCGNIFIGGNNDQSSTWMLAIAKLRENGEAPIDTVMQIKLSA